MTNFVYFISVTYLKDNTPINENVDDKLLKSAIKEAQEIYVRDIIGSGVYNELLELKNNNVIIDKSIENIYSNLDYNNYKNDIKLIRIHYKVPFLDIERKFMDAILSDNKNSFIGPY